MRSAGPSVGTVHVIGNVQLDVVAGPVLALPRPGGDDIVDSIAVRPAGAAGNVSLALAALGVRHRLFGVLGDDQAGRWVADELRRCGLAEDLVIAPGQETGISIALEAPARERAFLTAHGVLQGYGEQDVPDEALAADTVVLTGYFSLPGLRGAGTRRLLERAQAGGATTVFDTGWDPEDWRGDAVEEILSMLALVDVFLPNEPEAVALTGTTDVDEALALLREHCPGWVVLKRGADGVVAAGPDGERLNIPAPPVVALDTTGAGDSLAAGMLAELSAGRGMAQALLMGVRVASTVVGRPSRDRYPSRAELLDPVRA
ncbi:MAG: carbohydrate kinase family protein [Nocardioidaceae bacterium]